MRVIYHPETETVEMPVQLLEGIDWRLGQIQLLVGLLGWLIEEMKIEELLRRNNHQ